MGEKPPPLDPDAVREFVANAHGNIDAVRVALAGSPHS